MPHKIAVYEIEYGKRRRRFVLWAAIVRLLKYRLSPATLQSNYNESERKAVATELRFILHLLGYDGNGADAETRGNG